jgi:predicted Kef-type K+ transport protein
MDLAIIVVTFALGFAAARVGLPPLVGYLGAGFALHAFGYETNGAIEAVAELGILLLLFAIGLKLRVRTLARADVWAVTGIHMTITTALIGASFLAMGVLGLPLASSLTPGRAALIGFAFSFSSTVFAVKALEERNEAASLAGRLAIGILIVQDLFAVAFLALAAGGPPSIWAIAAVAAVIAARPLLGWVLDNSGHGELLMLLGVTLAVGVGAQTFDAVGLKPDLGALLVGMTLAGHRKANELAKQLLGLKDLLLVGFFLSIGLGGTPGTPALIVAAIALIIVPVKAAGFLLLLSRFRLRARTSMHTSVTLATYSEFGLIVAAVGVDEGLVDQQWLSAIAVAVAVSFVGAAALNKVRYTLYGRWSRALGALERQPINPDDALVEPTPARIVIFGMGRVGQGAYDEFVRGHGDVVLGVDRRDVMVDAHLQAGRNVIRGDALDRDFWERLRLRPCLQLAVLAMNDHDANLEAARRVKANFPDIRIAATARYADQVTELQDAGVDIARNLYGEAGQGLADDAADLLEPTAGMTSRARLQIDEGHWEDQPDDSHDRDRLVLDEDQPDHICPAGQRLTSSHPGEGAKSHAS